MNKKTVPMYVLDPKQTQDAYMPIQDVEPGSELARAVVQREWDGQATGTVREALKRIRDIAEYLHVPFEFPQ